MNIWIQKSILLLVLVCSTFGQGFKIRSTGEETFYFKDTLNRNQASFLSEASFESFRGISNDVSGYVSFNTQDVKNTLIGEVSITVNSIKTGIDGRDKNLQSVSWLNSEKYPLIVFRITEVETITPVDDYTLKLSILGEFSLHGKTKLIYAKATIKYFKESEETKSRADGNLIDVKTEFDIKLSDFGISHIMIGKRVSDIIKVSATLLGSNVKTDS